MGVAVLVLFLVMLVFFICARIYIAWETASWEERTGVFWTKWAFFAFCVLIAKVIIETELKG